MLQFNTVLPISSQPGSRPVKNLYIGNEPSNNIYQYYANNTIAGDKLAKVALSNYNLSWENESRSITSQRVSSLGIKTFPQVGAIGFYVAYNDDRSFILSPIHLDSGRTDRPTLAVTVNSDNITFNITNETSYDYMCYRIVMRLGFFAIEYVTYESSLTVELPEESGTYDIYCVGYIAEGSAVSSDSLHQAVPLIGTGISPSASDNYTDIIGAYFDSKGYLILRKSDGTTVTSDNTFISQYDTLESMSRLIGVFPDEPELTEEYGEGETLPDIIGGDI